MEHIAFTDDALKFLNQVPVLSDEARLSPEQLAIMRQCSLRHLENERRLGRGPKFEKHGRLVRYKLGTVREWMKKSEREKV